LSTYAVFGMTRARALEMARKSVKTWKKDPNDSRNTINLSAAEWEAAVQAEADKVMAGTKVVQLSDKYDAPSFAFDYLNLARKHGARGLHVKSYAKTGEKNPKTGKDIMAWELVSEADMHKHRRSA
jgi:hypothetical protein